MPQDIEACTRHVGDKADNPFALCQWMKKESRGYFAHGESFDLAGETAAFAEAGSPGTQAVIPGVHIFQAGEWQGEHYPPEALAEMVENFNRFSSGPDPLVHVPVVIGHEEEQDLLGNTGIPAVGHVEALGQRGPNLFADLSQIFPRIADLIEAGAYDHVSAEIYPPDHLPEGVDGARGHMLRRVALLGGALPHLKDLESYRGQLQRHAEKSRHTPRVTLHPLRKTWQDTAGAWACFSEVRKMADDATTQIAEQAIRDAYPDLPDELIQSFTPDQLSILAGSMAGQAAPAAAPEEAPGMEASPGEAEPGSVEMQDDLGGVLSQEGAAGAQPGRDEMITQLVGVGEDPAALQAMSDEDLQALYEQRIGMGGEAGEGAMPMAEVLSQEAGGAAVLPGGQWPSMTPMAEPESLETSMPTMESPVASPAGAPRQPTKVTMTQHFSEARVAALEARLKAAEAFARRAEQMARRKHAEGQRGLVRAFCERLVREGKAPPAEVEFGKRGEPIGPTAFALCTADTVRKFSEHGNRSALEVLMAKLDERPARYFGEQVPDPLGQGAPGGLLAPARERELLAHTRAGRRLLAERDAQQENHRAFAEALGQVIRGKLGR